MGSQVVVLAVPIGASLDLIDRLAPSLPTKTLLTDVGSTKGTVLDRASKPLASTWASDSSPGTPWPAKNIRESNSPTRNYSRVRDGL